MRVQLDDWIPANEIAVAMNGDPIRKIVPNVVASVSLSLSQALKGAVLTTNFMFDEALTVGVVNGQSPQKSQVLLGGIAESFTTAVSRVIVENNLKIEIIRRVALFAASRSFIFPILAIFKKRIKFSTPDCE